MYYYIPLYALVTLPQLCHLYNQSVVEGRSVIEGDSIVLDCPCPRNDGNYIECGLAGWYSNSTSTDNFTEISYGDTKTIYNARYDIVSGNTTLTLQIKDVKLIDGDFEYICGLWNYLTDIPADIYKVFRLLVLTPGLQPNCTSAVYTTHAVTQPSTQQSHAKYNVTIYCFISIPTTLRWFAPDGSQMAENKANQLNEPLSLTVTLFLNDTNASDEFKCNTSTGAFCTVIPLEILLPIAIDPATSTGDLGDNIPSSITSSRVLPTTPLTKGRISMDHSHHTTKTAVTIPNVVTGMTTSRLDGSNKSTTYRGITKVFGPIDNADDNNLSSFRLITYIVSGTVGFLIITVGIVLTACALRKKKMRAKSNNTSQGRDSPGGTTGYAQRQNTTEQSRAANCNADPIDENNDLTVCTPTLPICEDIERQNKTENYKTQPAVAIDIAKSDTMKSSCSFSVNKPIQVSSRSTEIESNLSKVTSIEKRQNESDNTPTNSTITVDQHTHLYYTQEKNKAEHQSDTCSSSSHVNDEILTDDEDAVLYALPLQKGGGHTLVKSQATNLPSIPLQESTKIDTKSLMPDRNTSGEHQYEIDEDLYNSIDEIKPLKNENPQVTSALPSNEDNVDACMQEEHQSIIPANPEEHLGDPSTLPVVNTQEDIEKSSVGQDQNVAYAKPLHTGGHGGGHTLVQSHAAKLPSIPLQESTNIDTATLMPERKIPREEQHEIDEDMYNTIDEVKPVKNENLQVTSPLPSKKDNELPSIPIQERSTEIDTGSLMPELRIPREDQHEIDEDMYNTIDEVKPVRNGDPQVTSPLPSKEDNTLPPLPIQETGTEIDTDSAITELRIPHEIDEDMYNTIDNLKPVNSDNPQVIPSKGNKGDAYTPEQHYVISAHGKEAHADSTSSAHGESPTSTVVNTQADIEKTSVTQDDDDDDIIYAQPLQKGGGHVAFKPVTAASNSPLSSGQTGVMQEENDDQQN